MPRFKTLQQYEEEIDLVQETIHRVLFLGEENENNSGGSSRSMKDTKLKELNEYLQIIIKEYDALKGKPPLVIRSAW